MKIVFFGTPAFPASFLHTLTEDPFFDVVGVICQPDALSGRKKILTPPPVKMAAQEKHLPVFQPEKLKEFTPPDADAFVVVAYGKIIPQRILDIPRLGTFNVHPSLLPKFRGPSPIISAIVAGEKKTGVTIMQLDAEMDHGPILAQEVIPLDPRETSQTLEEKVVRIGSPLLVRTLKEVATGLARPQEQDHAQATFCHLLDRKDGIINWMQPLEKIDAQIRGLNPWPGTTTTWKRQGKPLTLKIFSAEPTDRSAKPGEVMVDQKRLFIGTGTQSLRILTLQPEGMKPMSADVFLNGYKDIAGSLLE